MIVLSKNLAKMNPLTALQLNFKRYQHKIHFKDNMMFSSCFRVQDTEIRALSQSISNMESLEHLELGLSWSN